jgi:hypothetical protein
LQYELFEDVQKIISSTEDHIDQQQQQQQQRPIELVENGQQPNNSTVDFPSVYDDHHPHHLDNHPYQQQHHHSEFELHTTLAPKYGGPLHPDCIDEAILVNETKDDVELRDHILMGQVPLIDTIFRYDSVDAIIVCC